ncbi:MAG: leucine-rich repeat protein [Clostridia bacterium]|nr:leucine-rich repeat protein [Clostridia bacterium]
MKKIITLLSTVAMMLALSVCFSASAAEERVVIDNVVYELTSQKYNYDRYDYGEHYAVTDFFEDETLAETTTKINIVDEIDGIEVKTIMTNFDEHDGDEIHYARYGQKYPSVTKISIPGTIKYINDFSFNFFPSVEKLYLPAELERIGWGTFEQMESLKSITLPAGVTYIPERAFRGCIKLEKVVVQGDITSIGDLAFCGCEKLASFDFSDTIKYLGDSSFEKTAITKAVVPENVDGDEGGAFSSCSNLEKIVYEDTSDEKAKYIGYDYFFWNCKNLKAIYIKTIPTERISIETDIMNDSLLLKDIYFAGSEELWEKLTFEFERAKLDEKGVKVHFYYKHKHNFVKSGDVTCTKGGTYTYSCECGDSYSYKVAKNTEGHKFGAWKIKSKSTYTVAGVKERKCSLCGKTEKKNLAIPKLGTVTDYNYTATLNSITITWEAAEGANGCRVYKYNTKTKKYVKVASIKNKTTYTFKNLEKGQNVKFKLQPYYKDSKGNVAFGYESKVFSVYTLTTAPANLKAESTDVGVVKLTWDSSGPDVPYYVTRNTSKEELQKGKGTDAYADKKETVTIKNLESGTTYYFMVTMNLVKTEDGVKTSNIVEVTVK